MSFQDTLPSLQKRKVHSITRRWPHNANSINDSAVGTVFIFCTVVLFAILVFIFWTVVLYLVLISIFLLRK
jgi:hypothetical protein